MLFLMNFITSNRPLQQKKMRAIQMTLTPLINYPILPIPVLISQVHQCTAEQ